MESGNEGVMAGAPPLREKLRSKGVTVVSLCAAVDGMELGGLNLSTGGFGSESSHRSPSRCGDFH